MSPSAPRNTASPAVTCGGPPVDNAPTVASTVPANNATDVAISSNITITFSEPVTATNGWATLTTGNPPVPVAVTISGGPTTFTLNPDADLLNSTTYTVTVSAANVTDQDGTPTPLATDYTFKFTTAAPGGICPIAPNSTIPQVQGSGLTSPVSGQTVRIQGVVTADFQAAGQLGGFFMQDLTGDANAATSDGIFIFNSADAVSVGDVVSVNGAVAEFRGATQIGGGNTVTVCATAPVPAPVAVDLPVPTLNGQEQYEGMLVAVSETLTVDQTYFLGRFGQVTVSADGRVYNPTNRNIPGSPEAIAEAQLNARRMLVVDDGSSTQNRSTIAYLGPDNTLRGGDTLNSLTGVLNQGLVTSDSTTTGYIVQPTVAPAFNRVSQRTAAPDPVGGNLKVASFNVLNYFNGPTFPTSRGADSLYEFNRQRTKIITAMVAIDADVFGLMEIENDGSGSSSAIQDLVNGLNAATAPNTYAVAPAPAEPFGTDAIKVAILYKPARVTLVGAALTSNNAIFDRPPFAQTFQLTNGEKFSVIVNHLKSKRCTDATGADLDQGDGQGCYNAKRVLQAQALLPFIESVKTSAGDNDVLVMGDLNSYGKENPITTLTSGGLVNEVEKFLGTTAYSYIFDGGAGYIDHALASASLDPQVTGVAEWHINTDEPVVLDYNVDFKNNPECTRTPCTSPDLYTPTPYASSDHDPVVIGLQLGGAPTPASFAGSNKTVNDTSVQSGDLLTYTLTISNSGQTGATFMLTDTLNANLTFVSATPTMTRNGQQLTATAAVGPNSQTQYSITVRVNAGFSGTINNSATLSGDGQSRTLNAPAVTVTLAPTAASFAGSSKTVNATTVQSGGLLTYTLIVSNSGQLPATFMLTDTLNANLTFVSATPTMVRNGQQLTASAVLGGGASATYTIVVRVGDSFTGTINNSATLSGDGQNRTLNAPAVTVEASLKKLYMPLIIR